MNTKLFGAQLKRRRKELGLTMEQLAELMDITVTSLNNVESGNNYFSMTNFINCCKILEVHPNYFFGYAFDKDYKNINENELHIMKNLLSAGLSPEELQSLADILTKDKDAVKLILELYQVMKRHQ